MKQQITFKMSDEEHQKILTTAEKNSLPVATFCRFTIMNKINDNWNKALNGTLNLSDMEKMEDF
jgi:hypothetical protein